MRLSDHQLTNPSFLEKLALDLIKSRKSNYPEDCIHYYLQQNKFILEDVINVKNKYDNHLKCTLVKHRLSLLEKVQQDFSHNQKPNNHTQAEKCIIYLHGLGSNRMQGFSLLPNLPKGYSLFTFDLSGSGKSEGDFTSYGFRQKQDIEAVLTYLYNQNNYREFIIWGRSMGAVASLLFNNVIAEKQNQTICSEQTLKRNQRNTSNLSDIFKCVKCIVADSPFCSFQEIAKDIALNKMSIPNFFTQIALKFLQNTFNTILYDKKIKMNFTPFQIDFTKNPLKPMVPVIFVYSLNDEIVRCQHSEKIIKSMQKLKSKMVQKIIIPECGHNMKRPQNVIQAIFQKIQRHILTSKNTNIQLNQKTNRNILTQSLNKGNQFFQKQTKNVRRKSFWNFQEQIQQNQQPQPQKVSIFLQNNVENNKFLDSKGINDKATVRRNIFNREQQNNSSNITVQNMKRRGLSLSSTIQRMQSTVKQNKFTHQVPTKIMMDKKVTNQNIKSNVGRIRNVSMQVKGQNSKKKQEQGRQSPRKGIQRCSVQLMHSKFQKSAKNRPSLGGNQNRICLGGFGSIEKNLKAKRQESKGYTNYNLQKHYSGNGYAFPAQKDSNKGFGLSTISNSHQILKQQSGSSKKIKKNLHRAHKNLDSKVINQSFESEPNIMTQDMEYRRTQSRQSLKTIDVGLMNNQVDEGLTSFINNKLQFQFDTYGMIDGIFSKLKTNEKKEPQSKYSNTKKNVFLSEMEIKQSNELEQNLNKVSNVTIPSHISLRPSSRLYHEKKKKKIQAQNCLTSKQNENMKITNERYLVED